MKDESTENDNLNNFQTTEKTKKRGRPTKYSPKLARDIILLVSQGYSLRKISQLPGYPGYSTMMAWQLEHMDFREGIAWMHWLWAAEAGRRAVELINEVDINADDGAKQLRLAKEKAKVMLAAAKLCELKTSPFGDNKQ